MGRHRYRAFHAAEAIGFGIQPRKAALAAPRRRILEVTRGRVNRLPPGAPAAKALRCAEAVLGAEETEG